MWTHLGFTSTIFIVINIMVITFQNLKILEHPLSWTQCFIDEEIEVQKGRMICSRSYCRIGAEAKNQILWPWIHYYQVFCARWSAGQNLKHQMLSSGLRWFAATLTLGYPQSQTDVKKYTGQNFLIICFHLSSNVIILQKCGSREKKKLAPSSQYNLC